MLEFLLKEKKNGELSHILEEDLAKMVKFQLWELVKQLKKSKNFNKLDRIALEHGHRILRLPPYQCDLNPIELVWAEYKRRVRELNVGQNIEEIKRIAIEVMNDYTVEKWNKVVDHVEK